MVDARAPNSPKCLKVLIWCVRMTAPIYPQSQKEKAQAYLLVMDEVRARLEIIRSVLATSTIHYGLIIEICYLQFRHISELVAIGCLLAYGDFKAYRSFDKAYSPLDIYKHLDIMWPHFFPQPVTISIVNGTHHINANAKPNAMTRKEMEHLWSQSGDHLHRLSISKFFKQNPKITEAALNEARLITAKIVDLLDNHAITIPSPKRMLVISLSQPDCRVRAQFLNYGDQKDIKIEEFILR